MEDLVEGLLVDVYAYLLPDLEQSATNSQFVRAADCAARLLVGERYASCCEVTPGACCCEVATWRGLAACWARNSVWLRASPLDVVCGRGLGAIP